MSHRKDKSGFELRCGQLEWRAFIESNPTLSQYTGRFPTGYGKTECILHGYEIARRLNGRNRLLIVVPTETQLDQYTNDFGRKALRMGIALTGVVAASLASRTLRYHKENRAEVFVMTIQSLLSSVKERGAAGHWILELLEKGSWMGAADEYHHLGDANEWGAAIRAIFPQVTQWMAVSATPTRRIGKTIFGDPVVSVSYARALEEGVVKDVWIKVRDYRVDMEMADGTPLSRTTTEIRDEIGDEPIDRWEARRQLRYVRKYCQPILFDAVTEIESLRLRFNARPQMLVYAHSCLHARAICEIAQSVALGRSVDWVGTGDDGRTDEENTRIIQSFKDVYDDRGQIETEHSLDILVQVNKASEGFDSKPVCVIVDLSLTGMGPQKQQQYGRGTRFYHDAPLVLYVPTDSDVAKFAHLRAAIFDLDEFDAPPPPKPCDCCAACPRCEHHGPGPKLPEIQVINAQLIGRLDYVPSRQEVIGVAPGFSQREGIHLDPENNPADYQHVEEVLRKFYTKKETSQSEETSRVFWKDKVSGRSGNGGAVGQVARDLVLRMYPGRFDKSLLARACEAINSGWVRQTGLRHEAMLSNDFRKKYQWLRDLQESLRDEDQEIPGWLKI